MFKRALIIMIGFALAACATANDSKSTNDPLIELKEDARLGQETSRICFNRNIDGFTQNTRRSVVLQGAGRKEYLVTIRGICSKLRGAQTIGLDNRGSCVTRGDVLIVSESVFRLDDNIGLGPDRCLIDRIYEWNSDAQPESVER